MPLDGSAIFSSLNVKGTEVILGERAGRVGAESDLS